MSEHPLTELPSMADYHAERRFALAKRVGCLEGAIKVALIDLDISAKVSPSAERVARLLRDALEQG